MLIKRLYEINSTAIKVLRLGWNLATLRIYKRIPEEALYVLL